MSDDAIKLEILLNSEGVSAQTNQINQSLKGMDKYVASAERGFHRLAESQSKSISISRELAGSFSSLTTAAAAYFSLNTGASLVNKLIEVRGEFQKTEVAYTTMLGSAEKANELMRQSTELALKSPFSMTEVAQGAKQLLAFNVPANEVIDTLKRMGDISAGLSVPLSRLQLVFGQVKAKGKLMGDDLRQFTETGIPLIEELGKKFNATSAEIYQMVSAGKIGFNDVKDVLFAMTNEGGKFYNLMAEQSKTLSGQMSNLQDAVERMFNDIGKSSQGVLAKGIGELAHLVEHYDEVLRVLGGLVTTYGAYKASLMLVTAIEGARNKVLAEEISRLSFSDRMKLNRLIVTQRQAQASLAEAEAEKASTAMKYQALQAEVAVLDIKKAKSVALASEKVQIAETAALQLSAAQAELSALEQSASVRQISSASKKVEVAQNNLLAAQETAAVARKQALSVSSQYYTAKQQLETAATAANAASKKVQNAQEALSVATKNANTLAESRLTIAQTIRTSVTQLEAKAQALLNATMLTNPIVAVTVAVAGLIYAYVSLRDTTTAAAKAEKEYQNQRQKTQEQIEQLRQKTLQLVSAINSETSSKLQQLEAYQKLQLMYPGLYKNMDLEEFKRQTANATQKQLNASLDKFSTKKMNQHITTAEKEIERLTNKLKELQAVLMQGTSAGSSAIVNEIENINKAIEVQRGIIEKHNADYKERLHNEKLANMTAQQRLDYWEQEKKKINELIAQSKRQTAEFDNATNSVGKMVPQVFNVGKGLSGWTINALLSQLSTAQGEIDKIRNLTNSGGVGEVRNKQYWEQQKKEAQEALDLLGNNQMGSKQWNENVAKIRQAELELMKYNVSVKQVVKEQNRLAKETQRIAESRKDLIREISEAERAFALNQMQSAEREVATVEDKYKKLKDKARELKLGADQMERINRLEKSEVNSVKSKQENELFFEKLEVLKDAYASYEALKTSIGKAEADKRYTALLEEFQSYGAVLESEINKLKSLGSSITPEQIDKLNKLEREKKDYNRNERKEAEARYGEVFQALMSFDEKRRAVEEKYQADKLQLEQISNAELRAEKLKELEFQRIASLDAINTEAYERETMMQKLSQNLIGITRKELANRIASLKEYLAKVGDNLTEEQRLFVQNELEKAEAVRASTDIGVEELALLQQKEELMRRIADKQQKGIGNLQEETKQLEEVNAQLKAIMAKKFAKFSEAAGQLGGAFSQLGGTLKEFDEGLGDTVETMGELLNVASDAAGAVASFASGDIIGGITKTIKSIAGIFSMGAKARESERKAQEQIKKWHDEIFKSQLNYNAELRKRVADEVKINDLYKSRVTNIKEEMEANKKNAQSVINDQERVFKKLLNSSTVIGMRTEKYGGFLGLWRKTRAVEVQENVAKLLGVGRWVEKKIAGIVKIKVFEPGQVELTDEIFDKLERLNAERPLTGDAKAAFEQLKKLRDEYGSINEARKELEKKLNEAITGTTADSLADSIKQGITSGKKVFADFADDIENFLRNAVIAGLETDIFKEKTQKLHEALAEMMKDGVITQEEREKFNQLYMAIVEESKQKLEMLNQAGLNVVKQQASANSLQGSIKAMSQESADILGGHLAGLRLYVIDIFKVLKERSQNNFESLSRMIGIQLNIERNTRRTAENTEKLYDINEGISKVERAISKSSNDIKAGGF